MSYFWGDSARRSIVHLDDASVDVPESSAQALRALRLDDCERCLWLDAICINQSDIPEKGQQVSMMSDIYHLTTRNLICLGESDETTALALMDIESILKDVRRETNDYKLLLRTLYDQDEAFCYSSTGLGVEIDLQPLQKFYSLPWFRRVWVVQEAALSRESVCYPGEYQMPLTDVLKAAVWLIHKVHYLPPPNYLLSRSAGSCRDVRSRSS